jgi:hypothetical protein
MRAPSRTLVSRSWGLYIYSVGVAAKRQVGVQFEPGLLARVDAAVRASGAVSRQVWIAEACEERLGRGEAASRAPSVLKGSPDLAARRVAASRAALAARTDALRRVPPVQQREEK